jgi:hypothetical protein
MAEGLLGGMLGEEEEAEAEAPDALAGAEAFASAVAAKLAGNDPGVARKTEVFLDKQAHLLEIQAEHLEDEHALRLTHLHYQAKLLRGQPTRFVRWQLHADVGSGLFVMNRRWTLYAKETGATDRA